MSPRPAAVSSTTAWRGCATAAGAGPPGAEAGAGEEGAAGCRPSSSRGTEDDRADDTRKEGWGSGHDFLDGTDGGFGQCSGGPIHPPRVPRSRTCSRRILYLTLSRSPPSRASDPRFLLMGPGGLRCAANARACARVAVTHKMLSWHPDMQTRTAMHGQVTCRFYI